MTEPLHRQSDSRRGAWHDAARLLHETNPDLGYTEIGRLLGVTYSAVYKVLHPDKAREYNRRENHKPGRQQEKNAWLNRFNRSEAGRGHCVNPACGSLMGIGAVRGGNKLCRPCFDAIAAVRRTIGEGMWACGWSMREMSEILQIDAGSYLGAKRAQGWDLPYRRTLEQVERIRAGRWGDREELDRAA